MATLEESLNTYLLTQTAITAYVGADIYHAARPEGLETDYICYEIVAPSNEPYAFANTDTAQPRMQIDVFSKNDTSCLAIGNLIATALNRFTGTLASGTTVIYSRMAGPMVMRDNTDERWYHAVLYWDVEYER